MILAAIQETFEFIRNHSLKTILIRIRERNVPWLLQLAIYGFCGVMATLVSVGQIVLLSKTIIPAYEGMLIDGQVIDDSIRARNLLINNTIAFFTTNFFVYFLNILLVFKQGRHHPLMEFFYFTLINSISFIISQVAGPWLVHQFGIATNIAILTNTFFAAIINFLARKFFVFKG